MNARDTVCTALRNAGLQTSDTHAHENKNCRYKVITTLVGIQDALPLTRVLRLQEVLGVAAEDIKLIGFEDADRKHKHVRCVVENVDLAKIRL